MWCVSNIEHTFLRARHGALVCSHNDKRRLGLGFVKGRPIITSCAVCLLHERTGTTIVDEVWFRELASECLRLRVHWPNTEDGKRRCRGTWNQAAQPPWSQRLDVLVLCGP